MTSRPRQWLDFASLYLLFLLARPMPRNLLLRFGRGLGSFVFHVVRFRRDVVLDNLRHAFGQELDEDGLSRLALRFYRNLGMTLMEFLKFPALSRDQILALVDVEGLEHLQTVMDMGRGALLVSGHFGNWELMGARAAAEGFPVSFIVKTQSNQRVDRIQNDIRRKAGVGVIRMGTGIKHMVRALRNREFIGLVADQDGGADGFFLEFMGRPASVFRGTAHYAWKFKCPIVTGFIFRQPDGRHVMRLGPPVIPDPAWDQETAVRELTKAHVQALERAIRLAPEQYFWVHRRWKTRPPGESAADST